MTESQDIKFSDLSSDEEDIETAETVKGYQFEPEYSEEQLVERRQESVYNKNISPRRSPRQFLRHK